MTGAASGNWPVSDLERGQSLARLGDYFPSGSNPKLLSGYLDQLRRDAIETVDLIEGVARVIHLRETRSFPPYAVILRECRNARIDRLKEHTADDSEQWSGPANLTPERTAEMVEEFRRLRRESRHLRSWGRGRSEVV